MNDKDKTERAATQSAGEAVARLQEYSPAFKSRTDPMLFEIVILDRARCADGMLLFAAPISEATAPRDERIDILRRTLEIIAVGDAPYPRHAAADALVITGFWLEQKAEQADSSSAAPSEDECMARLGRYVTEFATKGGWTNDGEGAFEFIQRHSYVVGIEDAGGKPQYGGTETNGSRWPISALAAPSPTGESQSVVSVSFQRLETVEYWAKAFADDPQRVAGAMIVKLLNEYAQLRAALATHRQTEGGGVSLPDDDAIDSALHDAMAEQLGDLYSCGRVWHAWQVGTMTENDFSIASEDDDIVYNFVSAAREAFKAMLAAAPTPDRATKAEAAAGNAGVVPEAIAQRTEDIRLRLANPTSIPRSALLHYTECLLAHIATMRPTATEAPDLGARDPSRALYTPTSWEVRDEALQEAADVCAAIYQDHRDQYKGRGKWATQDNPRRADTHADGCSDGASQCEDAILELKSQPAAAVAGEAVTDEQVIGVLHSLGIDTKLSVNGFDELQVSGTNVPGVRAVVTKCIASIASGEWPAPIYDFDDEGKVAYRDILATSKGRA